MRVDIDNNIPVSALWSALGVPAQIVVAFRAGRFTLVTSEPILEELAEVLARAKFRERGIAPAQVEAMLNLLQHGAEQVEVPETLQVCSDPKDDKFAETAVLGQVDLVVSGDKHLHEPAVVAHLAAAQIEVIRPADFVRTLQLLQPIQAGDLFTDWQLEP